MNHPQKNNRLSASIVTCIKERKMRCGVKHKFGMFDALTFYVLKSYLTRVGWDAEPIKKSWLQKSHTLYA